MGRTDNKGHKTKGEPREIYIQGVKEPVAKIDELHNLFHKPSPFQVEEQIHYRIESDMNCQSHYFEQKYKRKDTIWLCEKKVEQILGDSWYWNWNNFAVRALHMRVMNFILPFDYHKVWFGAVIKGGQKFPELMFEEELKQVSPQELKEIQENFHKRALTMTTDTEFNTTPSEFACRWCSFTNICKDNFYAR